MGLVFIVNNGFLNTNGPEDIDHFINDPNDDDGPDKITHGGIFCKYRENINTTGLFR